jgi:uncharacterized protein
VWFRCRVAIADERYVALTPQPTSPESASSVARVVPLSDGRIGLWTTTELAVDRQAVAVQACDRRGVANADAPALPGSAEVVRSGRLFDEVQAKVRRKYGVAGTRLLLTDRTAEAVVLVRLEEP